MRKRVLSIVIVAAAALGTIALATSTPAQAAGCPNNAFCVCFP